MVRRAGKRNSSSSRKDQPDASASSTTNDNGSSRIRSKTPPPGGTDRGGKGNQTGGDRQQQKYDNKGADRVRKGRGRSSERNSHTRRTANTKENDNINNNNDGTNLILSAPRVSVPSTWTTSSGKFQPNESGLGFDASSHAGIHGRGATSVKTTGNNSEKTSTTNLTSLPDNFVVDDNSKKKSSNKNNKLLNGELEDPVARQRFYKNLKKMGIKKEIIIDHDQCDDDNDGKTTVSEMSFSEASYILDLAQQKESREKDRQEEALEEALELYRTWLLEGKNDDKNIFLMILDEMKKERKEEYEEIDRKHDALFNEALDAEIKRRETGKKQQENKKGTKEDPPVISTGNDNKQKSTARIDKILERNNSSHHTIQEKQDTDEYYDDHYPDDWDEPNEEKIEKKDKTKSKMLSSTNCNKISRNLVPPKKKNTNILARFYGSKKTEPQSKDCLPPSKLAGVSSAAVSKKAIKSKIDVQRKHQQLQEQQEESRHIFSRLRTNLSEKKIQEKSEEDKWWKKINEAKTEEMLWNQSDEKYLKVNVPEITDDTPPLPPLSSTSTSMSDNPIKDNINISESKKEKKKSHKRRKSDKGVDIFSKTLNTEKKTNEIGTVSPVLVKNNECGDGESNKYHDSNGKVVPLKGKTESRMSKVEKKELKDDGNNNVEKNRPLRKKKSIKGFNRKDINESIRTHISEEIQNNTKKKKKAPTIISSSTQSDKNTNTENLSKGTKKKMSKLGSVRLNQENEETTDKLKSFKVSTKKKKKTKINRNARSDNIDQSLVR